MRQALLVLLFAASLNAYPAPALLIVQDRVPVLKSFDPNLPVANLMAAELEADARVVPIVWSLSDPIFRTAYEKGDLGVSLEETDLNRLRQAAAQLRCDYLLWIQAERKQDFLLPNASLYKIHGNLKPIWKFGNQATINQVKDLFDQGDIEGARKLLSKSAELSLASVSVKINGLADWDSTGRSLVASWTRLLISGPLKHLPQQKSQATPAPDPGTVKQAPNLPFSEKPLESAEKFLKAGKFVEALNLLRDAVDAAPTDVATRIALAKLLIRSGMHQEAADQAWLACELSPDRNDLRFFCVQAYLEVGKLDEAQSVLNELLARNVEGPNVQVLLAEVALRKGDAEAAIQHFGRALASGVNLQASLGRAMGHALKGDFGKCQADLLALPVATPEEKALLYLRTLHIMDPAWTHMVKSLREVLQASRLNPKQKQNQSLAQKLVDQARAWIAVLDALSTPEKWNGSHARRKLAQKLLLQASNEALLFARSGSEDDDAEAMMSLGEAAKEMRSAQELLKREQETTEKQ